MATVIYWAYIIDSGSGAKVERSSHPSITVETRQAGEYEVTFPRTAKQLGVIATMNNSVGFITAVPGDFSGLAPNQVKVMTTNPDNAFGSRDFTVAVYSKVPWLRALFGC